MRPTPGPSRTNRPRSANGRRRKGGIGLSGFGSDSTGNFTNSAQSPLARIAGEGGTHAEGVGRVRVFRAAITLTRPSLARRPPSPAVRQRGIHGSAQTPREDALLDMQAVFRLVPDDRLRAVDDPGRDLLA